MTAAIFGLALAAFLAATPLPMNSEVAFVAMQASGYPIWILVLVASLANTLGSCVTYACGVWAERLRGTRWFPLPEAKLDKAQAWFARWGRWSLLLSWAPGGDVIVALSGVMRVPFVSFLALVALAKTLRYLVVALIAAGVLSGF